MDNDTIIREFIDAWSRLDPEELCSYFTEDGVYHNMPSGPVGGRGNVKIKVWRDYFDLGTYAKAMS
jgi:limonene-1,2-epoxide hydrolase